MKYFKKLIAGAAIGTSSALLFALPAAALPGSNTVTTGDIVDGAVQTADVLNDTLSYHDIGMGAVRSSEIADGSIEGRDLATDIQIGSSVSRATGATGSAQTLAGDMTYNGAAGGTSYYHAGVMGNFLGDDLTNTTSSLHGGVIGSYNVTTDDDNTGASAGVIGESGDMADTASYAVLAALGGDGGASTPRAAYGVQYFNSTAGSHFEFGIDLFHSATADYTGASAVDFGVADIRLASGATISSGSSTPGSCVTGSLFLDTDGGADATLRACTATNTWTAVSNE